MPDETPEDQAARLSDDERGERLAALNKIIELMRPAVQADGGDLVLMSADVERGIVEVQLQGACSSCAVCSSTLQGGVDRILKGRLDWVTEVIGGVDESDLAAPRASAAVVSLVREELAWARACFDGGSPLEHRAPRVLRPAIGMFLAGGRAIANCIERAGFDTLAGRPAVGKWTKLRLACRAWWGLRTMPAAERA